MSSTGPATGSGVRLRRPANPVSDRIKVINLNWTSPQAAAERAAGEARGLFGPQDGPGAQDVISRAHRLGMQWTPAGNDAADFADPRPVAVKPHALIGCPSRVPSIGS